MSQEPSTVLADLIAGVRQDLDLRRQQVPLSQLEAQIDHQAPALDPLPRLADPTRLSVIAEVKRASPSRGGLATIPHPNQLAQAYAQGGAAAVSVLTEQRRFGGSLADLAAVRLAVDIPVLRKDFIVTEYQVIEARAYGADLVLLIVAGLEPDRLGALYRLITQLGMTALVEAHTLDEVRAAVELGARLIGVNNRNLKTLEVDLGMFAQLADHIPPDTVKVAESGIVTPQDAAQMRAHGADAILVGEALVRDSNPRQAVQAMMNPTIHEEKND